jgi:hypothetical protein
MNSEYRYITKFIDCIGLLKFIICSKSANLSIAENLGCVSVGYSEDRKLETAVTVFRFFIPVVFYANEGGWVRQNTTVIVF